MIVYLEGPDGSGKSTLAKHIGDIARAMDYKVELGEPTISTKPTDPHRVDKEFLKNRMVYMFDSQDTIYILDRGPVSDCIYRLFDDYEPVLEFPEVFRLLRIYAKRLFFVYCNNSKAEEYMRARGDDNPVALAKHHKITQAYDMTLSNLGTITVHRYDFTNILNEVDLLAKVKEKLESWKECF